jgi:DNA-binding NarL/FixJ family response regulator
LKAKTPQPSEQYELKNENKGGYICLNIFPQTVSVLIADDHEIVRKGVAAVLSSRTDLNVCDEASNAEEAVDKALTLLPDLVMLDVSMPVIGGFTAARIIRKALPCVPILVLSVHEGSQIVQAARVFGAHGFVSKGDICAVLLNAVDALLQGQTYFPDSA